MEAKWKTLESVVTKQTETKTEEMAEGCSESTVITQHFERDYPQSGILEGHPGVYRLVSIRKQLAPQVGLEPTTLRLTEHLLSLEHVCFQRSSVEPKGRFGASMARISAKNSAKS